jgi:hypothetical protein
MATNLIQIKRSLNTANATSLANGELAYTANGDVLWIGSNGSIKAIGGNRTPGTLTANQALVANSTSGIDKVITSNAVVTTLTANGTTGTAGQVLTSNGTVSYWSSPASSSFTIAGDSGTDSVNTGETLTFASANGLTTAVTDNQVAFSVDTGSSLTVNATGIHVNSTNLSIATSQLTGDVALGSNTSGNYVATITAGSGISGSSSTEGGAATIAVVAGAGIASNSTGVHVVAGNGTVVSNATGVYVNASALSIATSQLTGDVALGTSTSGNYVATITAGNGISGSSTGEGGTPTIAVVAGTNGGLVSNSTGVFVSTGNGLLSNATGVHVGAANGINVTADAVGLTTGSTLTVNTTGAHVNTTLSLTSLTTSGDVQIGGNLTILGDLLTINVATLAVEDSLIQLASNNTASDLVDIGFFGSYEAGDAGAHEHAGIFRDASDSGIFKIFTNLEASPTATVNTTGTGYTTGTLEAFLKSGALVSNSTTVTITANSTVNVNMTANSLTLSTPLAATSGGTGLNTYTSGDILVANTGNTLSKMALGASGYILMSNGTALTYDTLDGGTF